MIEYVTRLIKIMKEVPEVQSLEMESIEKFISHFVWHKEDYPKKSYWWRLENRLNEMLSRRKKLLRNLHKKEMEKHTTPSDEEIAQAIEDKESQKASLLKNFKVNYLENMLKSSTKSVARDVVSTLIDPKKNEGALLVLTRLVEQLPEYEEEEKQVPEEKGTAKRRRSSSTKRQPIARSQKR